MGDTMTMMGRVFFALIIIIGLFYVIVKMLAQKNKTFQSGRAVKSWGGVTLAQHKSVQLIEVGRVVYVVGVGNDVTLLATIDDPEEIQYIRDHLPGSGQRELRIADWLGRWKKHSSKETDELASFQQLFQNNLQHITARKKKVEELIEESNKGERSGGYGRVDDE